MELTLEAAFSSEGMLGHFAYLLLVLSMLMRQMVWLRLFFVASAIVSIAYAFFVLTDPVGVFWESLLILVNTGQLFLIWWTNRNTQFDARETAFRFAHFPDLSARNFKILLSAGRWANLPAQTCLATEGQPVPALVYLAHGVADVRVGGNVIGLCGPGSFVGEMTVSKAEPASATVVLQEPADVWQLQAQNLRDLVARNPDINAALDAAFFRVLRARIIERNHKDAAAQFGGASGAGAADQHRG